MIAKAVSVSHGANAIRYSVNKDRADIVKVNLLPDNITPEAMYQRMLLTQKFHAGQNRKGRPIERNTIRIEVSPAADESQGWTMDDWARLADEFIREFDAVDLSKKAKRASAKRINLQGSQYVVSLHRDANSGIMHLHINANRVDNNGMTNDDHFIGERAVRAAQIINERRGWVQAADISIRNKQEIANCCMVVLRSLDRFSWDMYVMELRRHGYDVNVMRNSEGKVCGYSIQRGNSSYKSSELGVGRNLTPSKIERTWAKLHPQSRTFKPSGSVPSQQRATVSNSYRHQEADNAPVIRHYTISTPDRHSYSVEIPETADNIIRQECSLEGAHPWAKIEEIQHTALLLFAGYLDAATSVAASSGGGGSSNTSGWGKDKDEDELRWAHRCARMANSMCKCRKGLHR